MNSMDERYHTHEDNGCPTLTELAPISIERLRRFTAYGSGRSCARVFFMVELVFSVLTAFLSILTYKITPDVNAFHLAVMLVTLCFSILLFLSAILSHEVHLAHFDAADAALRGRR